jgi:hypothetical protein
MAGLSTQERILIELKKQNALLEEQLRPQREEERRRELWRQEQEDNRKLECELNRSRRIIAERHLNILGAHENLKSLSNQRCPITIDLREGWNREERIQHQCEEARKWNEQALANKLKIEEDLKELHESENKHLTKLRKYYRPDVYAHYINRFINEIRQRSIWQISDDLKRPYSFKVRL